MIAMTPAYPATDKPVDILKAQRAMQARFWFSDVQVQGRYPSWLTRYQKAKHFALDITDDDLAQLEKGKVDYLGLSYYKSFAVAAHDDEDDYYSYNETNDVVENDKVPHSDWGWEVDPRGLRYSLNWLNDRYHVRYSSLKTGLVPLIS